MTYLWDLLALVGLALILFGAYLVYPPLAPILGGLALLILGLWGSRLWAFSRPSGDEAESS
jgi:hypothetical protein